jgi:hypothetical protein
MKNDEKRPRAPSCAAHMRHLLFGDGRKTQHKTQITNAFATRPQAHGGPDADSIELHPFNPVNKQVKVLWSSVQYCRWSAPLVVFAGATVHGAVTALHLSKTICN